MDMTNEHCVEQIRIMNEVINSNKTHTQASSECENYKSKEETYFTDLCSGKTHKIVKVIVAPSNDTNRFEYFNQSKNINIDVNYNFEKGEMALLQKEDVNWSVYAILDSVKQSEELPHFINIEYLTYCLNKKA